MSQAVPVNALSLSALTQLTSDEISAHSDPGILLELCELLERRCTALVWRRQIEQATALADVWNLVRDRLNELEDKL